MLSLGRCLVVAMLIVGFPLFVAGGFVVLLGWFVGLRWFDGWCLLCLKLWVWVVDVVLGFGGGLVVGVICVLGFGVWL